MSQSFGPDAIERRMLRRCASWAGREMSRKNIHQLIAGMVTDLEWLGVAMDDAKRDWSLFLVDGDKLDAVAARYGVIRSAEEVDDVLRERLITEVMICTCTGHVSQIKEIMGRVLGIAPSGIQLYLNSAPSLGIDIVDSFIEVSVPEEYMEEDEQDDTFEFSQYEDESEVDSFQGFDYGAILFPPEVQWDVRIPEILRRIVAAGVGFTVSLEGSFRYSDVADVPDEDSDEGFDAGKLSGVVT